MQAKQDLSVNECSFQFSPCGRDLQVWTYWKLVFRVVATDGAHMFLCIPTDSFWLQLCLRAFWKPGACWLETPQPSKGAKSAKDTTTQGELPPALTGGNWWVNTIVPWPLWTGLILRWASQGLPEIPSG